MIILLLKALGRWDADDQALYMAARGRAVDHEALAGAYWRKYYGTYFPRTEWRALSKPRRGAIYRQRLKLVRLFNRLPLEQKQVVKQAKPEPPFQ
jgi:hypothetical protein